MVVIIARAGVIVACGQGSQIMSAFE